MGGMFDPVHQGHLDAARRMRDLLGLDLVLLVPCGTPVHRGPASATAEQRCAMLDLAVMDTAWLHVDRREIRSSDPSWTHDTLTAIRAERPDDSLYLIMGADAFLGLPSWRRWRDLPDLAHIVVCARPGFSLDRSVMSEQLEDFCRSHQVDQALDLRDRPAGGLLLAIVDTPALSSTEVRLRAGRGDPLTGLLPPTVADYVTRHQLYAQTE